MNATTRTGLMPTTKHNEHLINKRKVLTNDMGLSLKFEALSMPLSLRPFGGLFNPFAKGCSVLCNHPAPTSVKEVINQLKSSLTLESRNTQLTNENAAQHETDNIPEDLFRRYTETDSRPLTPTPSIISAYTRTSAGGSFFNRRCITPEWDKTENIKRKKIILDLRRTHSQEMLYWKPSSELNQSCVDDDKKPKSAGANEKKISRHQRSAELRSKSSLSTSNQATEAEKVCDVEKCKMPVMCINEHEIVDADVRRGKKRKKMKPTSVTTTFHLSEDPETQVATLGPDSLNPSTRASLIPSPGNLLPNKDKCENVPTLLKGSFLTDEAFQILKTELDVDIIENTFSRYLNRALREAIKYMPPKHKTLQKKCEEMTMEQAEENKSKMPRKFSKSATRFDVPLDLTTLEALTPLDYLSQNVWVSEQRKQLYKRVFLKYLNKCKQEDELAAKEGNMNSSDEQFIQPYGEYVERTMHWQSLYKALEDVLDFHGTEKNINEVLRILNYEATTVARDLDFRTWCGIVAFAERLVLANSAGSDSCDELEKTDFGTMEQFVIKYEISDNLRKIFDIIRSTHNLKYSN